MSDFAWDLTDDDRSTPHRRQRTLAVAAVGVVVLAAAFWLLSGPLTGGPSRSDAVPHALCQLQEAREGSGFEKWKGLDIEHVRELAARQGLRVHVVERSMASSSTSGKPVIEISRCGIEPGAIKAVVPASLGR